MMGLGRFSKYVYYGQPSKWAISMTEGSGMDKFRKSVYTNS